MALRHRRPAQCYYVGHLPCICLCNHWYNLIVLLLIKMPCASLLLQGPKVFPPTAPDRAMAIKMQAPSMVLLYGRASSISQLIIVVHSGPMKPVGRSEHVSCPCGCFAPLQRKETRLPSISAGHLQALDHCTPQSRLTPQAATQLLGFGGSSKGVCIENPTLRATQILLRGLLERENPRSHHTSCGVG
jgi:hypothetical protein